MPDSKDYKINKIKILFVDDEPDLSIIVKKFIELYDPLIQVDSIMSPEEALIVFHSYDCIVSDYKLPKMNGIELARKIRETSNIPFILYTGHESEEISSEASKVGVDACITKGFDKSQYKNLKDFEGWIIKDYKLGENPKWSNQHKILLKKEIDNFSDLGTSYKVQLIRGGYIYHCCYIIVETSEAYLWIDFTATQDTYDLNFEKLKELLSKFRTL